MNANRPRHSVLDMFDPLTSITSPSRDVSSPDSDKENSSPSEANNCTMTNFFGRSYKQAHEPPVTFKRRLIDIGDMTIDDVSMLDMLTEEEGPSEGENEEENQTAMFLLPVGTPSRLVSKAPRGYSTPSHTSPRKPFGELDFDDEKTPVPRPKTFKRLVLPTSGLSGSGGFVVEAESNLLSIINAVNSSGSSFAFSNSSPKSPCLQDEDLIKDDGNMRTQEHEAPQITISSSDPGTLSDSLSMLNLQTSTGSLLTDTVRPFLGVTFPSPPRSEQSRLRPHLPNTSSRDHNRRSIDLSSSFQIHMQSEETNFDLLNDKISFFASEGADSFLNNMDDSFDMEVEEAKMESALARLRLDEKSLEDVESLKAIDAPPEEEGRGDRESPKVVDSPRLPPVLPADTMDQRLCIFFSKYASSLTF